MEEMKDLDSPDAQFQPITLEGLHDLYDDVTDPASFGWTPPIHNLVASTSPADAPYPEMKTETFKVIAYLDQERPLSEPKWIKTGNVEEWLGEIFGPLEGGKGLGWRGKFEILDPEPVRFDLPFAFHRLFPPSLPFKVSMLTSLLPLLEQPLLPLGPSPNHRLRP
jgi:hypothetical protein